MTRHTNMGTDKERMFDEGSTIQIVLSVEDILSFKTTEGDWSVMMMEYLLPKIVLALEEHGTSRLRCHKGDYPHGTPPLYRCVKKEGHKDEHRYEEANGDEIVPWFIAE